MIASRAAARAAAPLVVCTVAALAVGLVPFTDPWLSANFHLLRERREEVVRQVQTGSLRPHVEHDTSLVALGSTGPTLSLAGNEIVVEKHDGQPYVFFFTYRGILDNCSGFLFVPDGGDPRLYSDSSEAESTQMVPFGGAWYFATHR